MPVSVALAEMFPNDALVTVVSNVPVRRHEAAQIDSLRFGKKLGAPGLVVASAAPLPTQSQIRICGLARRKPLADC